MNMYDFTGYLFIGGLLYGAYKKLSPYVNEQRDKFNAMSFTNKEQAGKFLDSLSIGQIYQVKTWINHKDISVSLMDSIGLNRYILLTDGGIGLTLEMCPKLFYEAMKRKGHA